MCVRAGNSQQYQKNLGYLALIKLFVVEIFLPGFSDESRPLHFVQLMLPKWVANSVLSVHLAQSHFIPQSLINFLLKNFNTIGAIIKDKIKKDRVKDHPYYVPFICMYIDPYKIIIKGSYYNHFVILVTTLIFFGDTL